MSQSLKRSKYQQVFEKTFSKKGRNQTHSKFFNGPVSLANQNFTGLKI